MKKLTAVLSFAVLLFLLVSCGDGKKADTEKETSAPDWRNLIEYEGSFYVDRETKILYANDTGKITLWDNGGYGDVLQEIEYDTLVPDAVDRMETDDVNADGYADIRIIYREDGNDSYYNLWLWDAKEEKFAPCRSYRDIASPENTESGAIIGTVDLGDRGILRTEYGFDENFVLVPGDFIITNADEIAVKICDALFAGAAPEEAPGKAKINGASCPVYKIPADSGAFLAYSADGEWFADVGCIGFYRAVNAENGKYALGKYCGAVGPVQETLEKLSGNEAVLTEAEKGTVSLAKAVRYTFACGEKSIFVITVDGGLWYYSDDGGEIYFVFNSSDVTLGEALLVEFTVMTEEETTDEQGEDTASEQEEIDDEQEESA